MAESKIRGAWAWESERFIFNPDSQAFVDSLLASGADPGAGS